MQIVSTSWSETGSWSHLRGTWYLEAPPPILHSGIPGKNSNPTDYVSFGEIFCSVRFSVNHRIYSDVMSVLLACLGSNRRDLTSALLSSRPAGQHAVPALHAGLHAAGRVEVRQHPLLPAALRPGARRARLHGDAQCHRPGPTQVGGAPFQHCFT